MLSRQLHLPGSMTPRGAEFIQKGDQRSANTIRTDTGAKSKLVMQKVPITRYDPWSQKANQGPARDWVLCKEIPGLSEGQSLSLNTAEFEPSCPRYLRLGRYGVG